MATGNQQFIYVVGLIGLIILFLACINYVSLTTAQAGTRTKEVGIRRIIGADGKNVFKRFFSESLIMTVIALILALSLVQLTMAAGAGSSRKRLETVAWRMTDSACGATPPVSGAVTRMLSIGMRMVVA